MNTAQPGAHRRHPDIFESMNQMKFDGNRFQTIFLPGCNQDYQRKIGRTR
jgi:hypothetical protein